MTTTETNYEDVRVQKSIMLPISLWRKLEAKAHAEGTSLAKVIEAIVEKKLA